MAQADFPYIRNTIEHELAHFGQTFLSTIIDFLNNSYEDVANVGLPSKKVQAPSEYYSKYDNLTEKEKDLTNPENEEIYKKYIIEDKEFYPQLINAISALKRRIIIYPVDVRLEFVKSFIGIDNNFEKLYGSAWVANRFFAILKEKAPKKWRKAVIELYKEINPLLNKRN